MREEKLPDDCCPKDGHKKEFENKSIAHAFKKQTLDIIPFVPQPDKLSYAEVSEETHTLLYYQEPSHDRQSTFFTDTIKLLLYRYISVLLPTCL